MVDIISTIHNTIHNTIETSKEVHILIYCVKSSASATV